MEDSEEKPAKLNGRFAKFSAEDFTATNFATAEDKAQWASKFTKFILGGFQRSAFKKEIYRQLHHMFGHCAEHDLDGFYCTWFESTYKCLHWVETVTTTWLAGIGQPQFTWSDVEIKLIKWICENNIHDQVAGYLQAETEEKERAMLKVLEDKYRVVPVENVAETVGPTAEPTPVLIEIPAIAVELGQLKLF